MCSATPFSVLDAWKAMRMGSNAEREYEVGEVVATVPRLLLTPEEAGEALAMSRTSVYRLLADRELAGVRIRGARRIPVAELERFVERRMAEAS